MDNQNLRCGDVVQIDPAHDDCFGGCFMIVTEPKPWALKGIVLLDFASSGAPSYF